MGRIVAFALKYDRVHPLDLVGLAYMNQKCNRSMNFPLICTRFYRDLYSINTDYLKNLNFMTLSFALYTYDCFVVVVFVYLNLL